MGCQNSFTRAGIVTVIAFFIVLLGNFFSFVSFTTTSWYVVDLPLDVNGDYNYGLWRVCRSKLISGCLTLDGSADAKLGAAQGFAALGFFGTNVGHLMVILYIFWDSLKKNSQLGFFSGLILLLSGFCWGIAVVVYSLGFTVSGGTLQYSFAFAVVTAAMGIVSGLLMFLAYRTDQPPPPPPATTRSWKA